MHALYPVTKHKRPIYLIKWTVAIHDQIIFRFLFRCRYGSINFSTSSSKCNFRLRNLAEVMGPVHSDRTPSIVALRRVGCVVWMILSGGSGC